MNLLEMIKELRTGTPDRKKAVKKLYTYGAIFIVVAVANYLFVHFQKDTILDSRWLSHLITLFFIAGLFLIAGGYRTASQIQTQFFRTLPFFELG